MRPLFNLAIFLCVSVFLVYSCKKEYSCEDCFPGPQVINNKPPVARAGEDQSVTLPADSTSLDGSNSMDPDGVINGWKWSKISGPDSVKWNSPFTAKTVVKNLKTGIYEFELNVTDNGGISSKDTIRVTVDDVAAVNHPPVADAGGNVSVIVQSTADLLRGAAILDGSQSSDPDNDIVQYFWAKISGPAFYIDDPTAVQIRVTSQVPGTCQFELKVTDSKGLFSRDTAQVRLQVGNGPPVANAGSDQSLLSPISSTSLDGTGSFDPDDNIIVYNWSQISGPSSPTIVNPTASRTQLINLVQGIYEFELKVVDGAGLVSTDRVLIVVNSTITTSSEIILTLPLDSVYLDGFQFCCNNKEWKQIAGPSVATLKTPAAFLCLAKNLVTGTYIFVLQENSGLHVDTITVKVVDDPLDPNTIMYKNLPWLFADEYGTGIIDQSISSPYQPNVGANLLTQQDKKLYIRIDASSSWVKMDNIISGVAFNHDSSTAYIWITRIPSDPSWANKKSDMKIKLE